MELCGFSNYRKDLGKQKNQEGGIRKSFEENPNSAKAVLAFRGFFNLNASWPCRKP